MKVTKPQDNLAQNIQFGVEIETIVPVSAEISIGTYHVGRPVHSGIDAETRQPIVAPSFRDNYWRAENDSSIVGQPRYQRCEFVSPVLCGEEGLEKLREFIRFAIRIGAKINSSCGLHVTVGIRSVIGTTETAAVAEFVQKLAHITQHNAWAIYAQTGTDRHLNDYSATFTLEVEQLVRQMKRCDAAKALALAQRCGRKRIVNFLKAFRGEDSAIEFRAFAGTLDEARILHHLATALGLMRRAATVQTFGRFDRKATRKHSNVNSAVEAVRRMWRVLGWVDSVPGRDCALGLFGPLHSEFGSYRKAALKMAEAFEQRFPAANL
jgi:hypothetical protein